MSFSPSGVVIGGTFGLGSGISSALSAGAQSFTVSTAQLDSGGNVVGPQPLAGGLSLSVNLNNSSPSVGTVPGAVTITGGNSDATGTFTPLTTGSTNISVVQPGGYSTPGQFTFITVNIH